MSPGTCHISRWHLLLRYMDSTEGELPYPDGHPHQRSALLAGAALVPDLSRSSKPRVMGVLAVRKRGHSGLEQTNSGEKSPRDPGVEQNSRQDSNLHPDALFKAPAMEPRVPFQVRGRLHLSV